MYKISVPATTANIGPGFDSFGLALKMYNHFTICSSQKLDFENCKIKKWEDNLVYTSAMKVFETYYDSKNHPKGMYIKFDTTIPFSRGLGSSATCIVAGVVGANLLLGQPYSDDDLFKMAVDIEGHPDNIAPAFFGGLNITSKQNNAVLRKKVEVSSTYSFYLIIPSFRLSTNNSRFVLPDNISLQDATTNISNATLLILSLIDGDSKMLKSISADTLHEPYRKVLIPGYDEIKKNALKHGALGCFLSGAGPSIFCIVEDRNRFVEGMLPSIKQLDNNWTLKHLGVDYEGVTYTNI
ncbi:homoserine kinase [Alkalibaculum sp. M08DMB]|uniref:Homoserine kinase n=1 Tax=Alkalibaculum sporogenes TaxID=2655001 RepID=A0A6A7KC30_9FIRM|nr:homoserine kinase [Alkalibaculum sporogenes]MPW26915.1 homoserine kinase [Alkalibaculum sporogenes]